MKNLPNKLFLFYNFLFKYGAVLILPLNKFSWFCGGLAGSSIGGIFVKSSLKLLVSNKCSIFGLNGASISFLANFCQSIPLKNLWALISSAPVGPVPVKKFHHRLQKRKINTFLSPAAISNEPTHYLPSLFDGSLFSSRVIRSLASGLIISGIGGLVFRIRFDISFCLFGSPSMVNGEAPVSNS